MNNVTASHVPVELISLQIPERRAGVRCVLREQFLRADQRLHPADNRRYARVFRGGLIVTGHPVGLLAP